MEKELTEEEAFERMFPVEFWAWQHSEISPDIWDALLILADQQEEKGDLPLANCLRFCRNRRKRPWGTDGNIWRWLVVPGQEEAPSTCNFLSKSLHLEPFSSPLAAYRAIVPYTERILSGENSP